MSPVAVRLARAPVPEEQPAVRLRDVTVRFTNERATTTALKVLGPDYLAMPLWDNGVKLYALPYYTTADFLKSSPDVLAGFLRATGRGWAYVKANPEKAVDLLVQEYPNLVRADELAAVSVMLGVEFTGRTASFGWGSFDPAVWQDQINLYDSLKQFTAGAPKLDDVISTAILDATKDTRPKIG